MEELKKIVKRFAVFGYTNHLKDYKDKRSKFLVNSMRKLNPEKIAKDNNERYGNTIIFSRTIQENTRESLGKKRLKHRLKSVAI